jgi:phosphoribosylglycinamide formyltransferase-1
MAAKIAIFASGTGTNARNIIEEFCEEDIETVLILSNDSKAGVLDIAREKNILTFVTSEDFTSDQGDVIRLLAELKTDLIVLAGFLKKIPLAMIKAFPGRIINIHPALLPKYGGKGMYGSRVHESVIRNGDKKSGITIHYVNERYDEGEIIFQQELKIDADETAFTLAQKIHQLEYRYYPEIIKMVLTKIKDHL